MDIKYKWLNNGVVFDGDMIECMNDVWDGYGYEGCWVMVCHKMVMYTCIAIMSMQNKVLWHIDQAED